MKPWITTGLALALVTWSAAGGLAVYELQRERPEDPRIEEARREAAMLRDRLEVVSANAVALAGATERGFEGLAEALEQRTAADERGVRDLASRLTSLEAELRGLAPALAARPAEPAVETTIAPAEVAEREPAEPVPPASEAPAVPAARRSFLAFRLPSQEQGFEGTRTYEVLTDLSRVGFDAKSTLHDFTGTSGRVRGSVRVDLARPAEGISGAIEIDARSLSTAHQARDEAMFEHLDADRFEQIVFTPTSFELERVQVEAQRVAGSVRGRMSIHGTEREVEMQVTGRLDDARRLVIEGEMTLALSDYGVDAPNKLGLISMEDQVRVWIHLRARARLGEVVQ